MADSTKKIVVITGCSSGIGLDTAVLLAKETRFKVIATMRNLEKKGDLEKAAGEWLNKSLFIQELDVSKEDSIVKFVKTTYDSEGRVDILINNAASGQHSAFESVSMEQMQALFQTNVFGTCKLTQEVVRKMKERRSGHIIFISSLVGVYPFPFSDFYVSSKFAIEGIVGSLAPVLRHFNIFVTSVEPGPVQTSFSSNIDKNNQGSFSMDDSTDVDEKTNVVRKKFLSNYREQFRPDTPQTGLDVAEVIKKCIYEAKPPTRIQTSEAMVKLAQTVLVDHTGDQVTDMLFKIME